VSLRSESTLTYEGIRNNVYNLSRGNMHFWLIFMSMCLVCWQPCCCSLRVGQVKLTVIDCALCVVRDKVGCDICVVAAFFVCRCAVLNVLLFTGKELRNFVSKELHHVTYSVTNKLDRVLMLIYH
jgi:hypothetical protein